MTTALFVFSQVKFQKFIVDKLLILNIIAVMQKLNIRRLRVASIKHGFMLPVVNLFFWPPEIPLLMASPTNVLSHMSSPSIWKRIGSQSITRKVYCLT